MRIAAACTAFLAGGCATYQAYEGPALGDDSAAVIAFDPRVNAGLPVVVAVRKVDERRVGLAYAKVAVDPGQHRLLVDCTVKESRSVTRFPLEVDALPGAHYRLVAELGPGLRSCQSVRIEQR